VGLKWKPSGYEPRDAGLLPNDLALNFTLLGPLLGPHGEIGCGDYARPIGLRPTFSARGPCRRPSARGGWAWPNTLKSCQRIPLPTGAPNHPTVSSSAMRRARSTVSVDAIMCALYHVRVKRIARRRPFDRDMPVIARARHRLDRWQLPIEPYFRDDHAGIRSGCPVAKHRMPVI
jgi:hypothetical protein